MLDSLLTTPVSITFRRAGPRRTTAQARRRSSSSPRGWEFGPAGVRVNAIAPGIIATDGNAGHADALESMFSGFPARRLDLPEEIAHAAVYLASDEAAFAHGSTLLVDGGALTPRAT